MKDAFHGSACPPHDPSTAHREPDTTTITWPYRGSSAHSPLRGTARTAPKWIRCAGGHCVNRMPAIALDIGNPWPVIPCWSGRARRWVAQTVPTAYRLRYERHVRPAMPNNPVSLKTLTTVAEARALYADHRTGRDCRPTNATLAQITGLSVRTVQRASTALRLLGVATEVVRGRQRTRTERYASWRVGDRGRGWASVWALHDSRIAVVSPHPEGSPVSPPPCRSRVLTTPPRRQSAGSSAATRRTYPETRALALANKWVRDPQSPPWARRYHTGTPWAHLLAGPARHGWTPRDVNQLISDWAGTGHWIPEAPHKPIGVLGAMLAGHGNLAERPAALDEAREAAEQAARQARITAQLAEREAHQRAREAARAAHNGPGRRAARQLLAEIDKRATHKRHAADRQELAARADLVERARRRNDTGGQAGRQ